MKKIFLIVLLFFSNSILSQYTGSTPWDNCFGKNASCKYVGCSDIKVNASSDPVMVIVKKNDRVIKHAYISSFGTYTFELNDGTYQVFFYYGDNWSSNKKMNSNECNYLYGGWTENEYVSKDNPIYLKGQDVTYTLTKVTSVNFTPKSSNLSEAL